MIGGALTSADVGKQVTFANGARATVVRRNKKDGGVYYNYKITSGASPSYLAGVRGKGKTLSAEKAMKAFNSANKKRSRRSALADARWAKS